MAPKCNLLLAVRRWSPTYADARHKIEINDFYFLIRIFLFRHKLPFRLFEAESLWTAGADSAFAEVHGQEDFS